MNKEQVITPFKKSGEFLAQGAYYSAKFIGEQLVASATDHLVSHQEAVDKFDGRVAVVTQFVESEDADMLEARAATTAYSLMDAGVVQEETAAEIRFLAPEEALRSGEQRIQTVLAGMGLLRRYLAEYNVEAIPNSLPITPTKTAESPVNPRRLWGAIGGELQDLRRQLGPKRDLAMVAMAEAPYAKRIFDEQPHVDEQPRLLDEGQLMVVRSIGEGPERNMLMPPQAATRTDAAKLLPPAPS